MAAASAISFNQPSPAAIAVYSHVRHQPSQNAEAQSTSILNRAKHEILRIIDLMVEKTQQEVVDLLTDVCTVLLIIRFHCIFVNCYEIQRVLTIVSFELL